MSTGRTNTVIPAKAGIHGHPSADQQLQHRHPCESGNPPANPAPTSNSSTVIPAKAGIPSNPSTVIPAKAGSPWQPQTAIPTKAQTHRPRRLL